jgi:tetratricopeptide (TPR) repeat protein
MEMMDKLGDDADGNMATIKKVQKLLAEQDFEGAKYLYDALPDNVKQQKMFMMTNVRICSGLKDQNKYLAAIEAYQKRFPNETNIPLLMIDLGFMRKDYARAQKAINDLDRLVGGDPFLNYYRGLAYKQAGDHANSIRSLEALYEYAPTFEDGVLELVFAYLDVEDYNKARPLISNYRKHKNWNQTTLDYLIQHNKNIPADLLK